MNDAELYQKSNNLQKRDALQCLEEYAKKIKWNNNGDRVIDIGCGDGGVTNILRDYMPANFSKLVGCDISEKMVNYANQHHRSKHIEFTVLDIEDQLQEELRESFDHVFSFYTLHWIKKQESAFQNIYDLLTHDGDCLLLFIGHMPLFDVYRILSREPKWSKWLKDVNRFVSPYHDSQNPEKEITKLMEKVGFENIDVKCKEVTFMYDDLEVLKKAVTAINPFKIPKDIFDDFLEDYLTVVKEMRLIDKANNNIGETISVRCTYRLLVVYGSKT